MKRTGLGKGISALFSSEIGEENEMIDLGTEDVKNKIVELKVIEVEPNKKQARKEFNYKNLEELA